MKAAGMALVIFGIFLWFGALLLFSALTRQVARSASPQAAAGFRRLIETGNPARIWREHRRGFPYSSQRQAMVILAAAAVVCACLGLYLAK
jgi:hypothetical protein